jgi:DNA mismatch repair protein MutS2
LKTAIDRLAEGFSECRSELSRLSKFGRATQQGTGYHQLAELLAYEDDLATLDLRVRVGVDGRLRSFELLGYRENRGNAFHEHWLGRLWRRLWMLLRGYRFGEQEILMRLTDHVFEGLKSEVLQLFQLLGDMDFYRSGLGLAQLAQSQQLEVCLPSFSEQQGLELEGVFNPFLVAQGVRVRRCNLRQEAPRAMTVITGPNSGGKTRLLQSLGLCQLLGQAGLPVPAKTANLCWTRGMFVSIVQETSADQREGRLGTELLRIRRLFERVTPGDVIVLDELCSGTNPSEGEEIFRLVIELLAQLDPQLWLTTHFLQFAARLKAEGTLQNLTFLQVELDAQEQPTYGFVPGVAKSSLAGQTAERLGVTWQELSALVSAAKQKHR